MLLKCHAGCSITAIVAAAGLKMGDLRAAGAGVGEGAGSLRPALERSNGSGLTLAAYAAAKRLPEAFLRDLGLTDMSHERHPAVRIPYGDPDGADGPVRFRRALEGEGRFRWRKGSRPCLYGLWRLAAATGPTPLALVEGESDAHTLWFHGIPALGLPGAASWREEWATWLDGIPEIWAVIEPDAGGTAMRRWIGTSRIRDRVRLVSLQGCKDVSALHLRDPEQFLMQWQQAVQAAAGWEATVPVTQAEDIQAAYAQAEGLLHAPDLMARVAAAIQAGGYAGDLKAPLIAYVALTSRVLDRPLNVAFVAPSGAGKNRAVDAALACVPPEAVHLVKAGSARALIYADTDYTHRYVVLAEADSLPEDGPAGSAMRSLVSDQFLSYEVVEKSPKTGRHETRRIVKPGPTGLITTSTRSLPLQMRTRTLEVPLVDDAAQTRAIMQAHAQAVNEEARTPPDLTPFLALQRWLARAGIRRVCVPFSTALAELITSDHVRMRRDFQQLLTAIQAVALLHQCQRSRTSTGAVAATLDDYGVVRSLLAGVFQGIVADGLTPVIRDTVKAVRPGERLSETQLAHRLGIAKSTASYRVGRALRGAWLRNEETRLGLPAILTRGEPLPDQAVGLPSVDQVRKVFERSNRSDGSPPPARPTSEKGTRQP